MNKNPVWVCGETRDGEISQITYEVMTRALTLARKLSAPLEVFIISGDMNESRLREPLYRGASRVLAVISQELERPSLETRANFLTDAIREKKPQIVLAAATSTGRVLMPAAAARLGTGLTADCTGLDIDADGNLLQTRPAVGGNIMASIKTANHRPQMATVRPRSAPQAPRGEKCGGQIERLPFKRSLIDERAQIISFRNHSGSETDIQAADVVVAGGRGLKKKENLRLLEQTAELLGGATAASRDAVDRGWAKYPLQVGLSGKTVVPRLYIAAGISGAIQHLAGMKTAGVIVAINRDPDAQIFKTADFGIIGDLFEILPVLNERLKKETLR